MLLKEEFYQKFIPGKTIANAHDVSQTLLCLSMESRDEVDTFVKTAQENGGKIIDNQVADGYGDAMYGKDVEDLDGHIWELLYMDMSKYPAEGAGGA